MKDNLCFKVLEIDNKKNLIPIYWSGTKLNFPNDEIFFICHYKVKKKGHF